jgi:hypothetical protein
MLWVHAHALNVRVDLEGPIAALDGMKSEANGVSRTRTECSRLARKGRRCTVAQTCAAADLGANFPCWL